MVYKIEFSKNARRQLSKLDLETQTRVIAALERIKIRPFSFVEKLVGIPLYRIRVGKYRVIIEILEDRLIILIIRIGHRKTIYKTHLKEE